MIEIGENRSMLLFDEVVHTDYGQFDLVWSAGHLGFDGDCDRFFGGQENGLVGAAVPDGLYINLARRSGGSRVRIELMESEPALLDRTWGDVVEVSVTVPEHAETGWATWAGESTVRLELPPGSYRVRVSAQNRDAGRAGEFAEAVVDSYRIQLWRAETREDEVLRVGSEDAQYWHREAGSRRSAPARP